MPHGCCSEKAGTTSRTRGTSSAWPKTSSEYVQTELFGLWQTEAWAPPAAENGIVPKNERGNVEVPPFAKCLPGGTVHVNVPRAFAACRRLEVDFAPALIGFEPGRGGMLPKIEGVVVCAEVADAVRASALEDEEARTAKARAKRCAPCRPMWHACAVLQFAHGQCCVH